jgi:alpha,alpha-trehalase
VCITEVTKLKPRLFAPLALLAVAAAAPCAEPRSILDYIRDTWQVLTRSHKELAAAAVDPKFQPGEDGKWIVYIPADADEAKIRKELAAEMQPADFAKIRLAPLSEKGNSHQDPGLLYLPRPYVVPGGRFNEMYGWDSYFIQVGLLRDGLVPLAKDMADNFLYEVREYGKVLNANRTYYLTRSQPPFLTQMVMGVYERTRDKQWLAAAVPAIEAYYQFWTTEPHLTPATGLSRYFDLGEGPAPEVVSAERDAQGRTHYELVKDYLKTHAITDYDVAQFYDAKNDGMTDLFYKGDRSMRESGFDPSNRFGPFNLDIIHYDPVCLNTLLYLMEVQTADILETLGRSAEAKPWRKRAEERAARINSLMWDEQDGLYYDYNFAKSYRRKYPFLTTFYPLWAGIASKEQAARIVKNLPLFERDGGLQTSTNVTGNQWDSPFGWAPLELIATQGLRRYGYDEEANRISIKWLKLIHDRYAAQGTIVEKYDVVHPGTLVSGEIKFGYRSNELGFGWTNASFTALYDALPAARQKEIGAN